MNLFVYGTLMEPKIQMGVVGRLLKSTPATLSGFKLLGSLPNGAPYKTIERERKSVVSGHILSIEPEDLKNLDRYEGVPHLYKRHSVDVNVEGKIVPALVYMYSEFE